MSTRESLIVSAVMKLINNMGSHKLSESDKKFLSKIEFTEGTGELSIVRILPRKCTDEHCNCEKGVHWSRFKASIFSINQKEQNRLFALAGRF